MPSQKLLELRFDSLMNKMFSGFCNISVNPLVIASRSLNPRTVILALDFLSFGCMFGNIKLTRCELISTAGSSMTPRVRPDTNGRGMMLDRN